MKVHRFLLKSISIIASLNLVITSIHPLCAQGMSLAAPSSADILSYDLRDALEAQEFIITDIASGENNAENSMFGFPRKNLSAYKKRAAYYKHGNEYKELLAKLIKTNKIWDDILAFSLKYLKSQTIKTQSVNQNILCILIMQIIFPLFKAHVESINKDISGLNNAKEVLGENMLLKIKSINENMSIIEHMMQRTQAHIIESGDFTPQKLEQEEMQMKKDIVASEYNVVFVFEQKKISFSYKDITLDVPELWMQWVQLVKSQHADSRSEKGESKNRMNHTPLSRSLQLERENDEIQKIKDDIVDNLTLFSNMRITSDVKEKQLQSRLGSINNKLILIEKQEPDFVEEKRRELQDIYNQKLFELNKLLKPDKQSRKKSKIPKKIDLNTKINIISNIEFVQKVSDAEESAKYGVDVPGFIKAVIRGEVDWEFARKVIIRIYNSKTVSSREIEYAVDAILEAHEKSIEKPKNKTSIPGLIAAAVVSAGIFVISLSQILFGEDYYEVSLISACLGFIYGSAHILVFLTSSIIIPSVSVRAKHNDYELENLITSSKAGSRAESIRFDESSGINRFKIAWIEADGVLVINRRWVVESSRLITGIRKQILPLILAHEEMHLSSWQKRIAHAIKKYPVFWQVLIRWGNEIFTYAAVIIGYMRFIANPKKKYQFPVIVRNGEERREPTAERAPAPKRAPVPQPLPQEPKYVELLHSVKNISNLHSLLQQMYKNLDQTTAQKNIFKWVIDNTANHDLVVQEINKLNNLNQTKYSSIHHDILISLLGALILQSLDMFVESRNLVQKGFFELEDIMHFMSIARGIGNIYAGEDEYREALITVVDAQPKDTVDWKNSNTWYLPEFYITHKIKLLQQAQKRAVLSSH